MSENVDTYKIDTQTKYCEAAYYAAREMFNQSGTNNPEFRDTKHDDMINALYHVPERFLVDRPRIEVESVVQALSRRGFDIDTLLERLQSECDKRLAEEVEQEQEGEVQDKLQQSTLTGLEVMEE
jgi:hypothetical protein